MADQKADTTLDDLIEKSRTLSREVKRIASETMELRAVIRDAAARAKEDNATVAWAAALGAVSTKAQ